MYGLGLVLLGVGLGCSTCNRCRGYGDCYCGGSSCYSGYSGYGNCCSGCSGYNRYSNCYSGCSGCNGYGYSRCGCRY